MTATATEFKPETRYIKGICREGRTGQKWHKATMVEVSVDPTDALEMLKTGGWKRTSLWVTCEGERSRGGKAYWNFIRTEDTSRCTCKDCKSY